MIDKQTVCDLFEYRDGHLYRKKTTAPNAVKGQLAETNCIKYLKVTINKVPYKIHRLVFLMHHGYMPEFIDHIDGNPLNNKIENLRACTKQENNRNQKITKRNTSGYKNVTWNNVAKKWQVGFMLNNNYKYIGTFKDIELADLVAQEARLKYFKQFSRHK